MSVKVFLEETNLDLVKPVKQAALLNAVGVIQQPRAWTEPQRGRRLNLADPCLTAELRHQSSTQTGVGTIGSPAPRSLNYATSLPGSPEGRLLGLHKHTFILVINLTFT